MHAGASLAQLHLASHTMSSIMGRFSSHAEEAGHCRMLQDILDITENDLEFAVACGLQHAAPSLPAFLFVARWATSC